MFASCGRTGEELHRLASEQIQTSVSPRFVHSLSSRAPSTSRGLKLIETHFDDVPPPPGYANSASGQDSGCAFSGAKHGSGFFSGGLGRQGNELSRARGPRLSPDN